MRRMRRVAVLMLMMLAVPAAARGDSWSAPPPAGWQPEPASVLAPGLVMVRQVTLTSEADAFSSPRGDATMARIRWTTRLLANSRTAIEQYERGVERGIAKSCRRHISDATYYDGDQLVGESLNVDARGVMNHTLRRYALDSSGTTHVFQVECRGSEQAREPCEVSQRAMKLELSDAIAYPRPIHDMLRNTAILLGAGLVISLGVLVWLLRRGRRRRA